MHQLRLACTFDALFTHEELVHAPHKQHAGKAFGVHLA